MAGKAKKGVGVKITQRAGDESVQIGIVHGGVTVNKSSDYSAATGDSTQPEGWEKWEKWADLLETCTLLLSGIGFGIYLAITQSNGNFFGFICFGFLGFFLGGLIGKLFGKIVRTLPVVLPIALFFGVIYLVYRSIMWVMGNR